MDKSEIRFLKQKDYKFIKELSRGGFGEAILINDETIGEDFVCKKYSPFYEEDKEVYYKNFVQEIKLLHLLNHRNIVRVFNYYLYPEKSTGYILMEYINGSSIDKFLQNNPDKIKDVFLETINGFQHLEGLQILHRDIRPQNILVTDQGIPKIIDFGFGKQMQFLEEDFGNSISLNWRYTPPSEFSLKVYDYKTEVYFVGKLFEEIINENQLPAFPYASAIRKMIAHNYDERLSSFLDVSREISTVDSTEVSFSYMDKYAYQQFAENLSKIIASMDENCQYNSDVDDINQKLQTVYNNSLLEEYLQNSAALLRCFLKGTYKYYNSKTFPISTLRDFVILFKNTPKDLQKIILNNIWLRFDSIGRTSKVSSADDLPF